MDLAPILAAAGVPLVGWSTHGTWLYRRLATARRDPLTGLHTRDGFTARAERLIRSHPERTTVLLVDLDDFKAVNDTHGHAAGDTVLATTANRLSTWCAPHGLAARLGGDEFAVVVLDATADRLEQLNAALTKQMLLVDQQIPVGASVGVCHLANLPVPSLTDALAAADRDMYSHKPDGRTSRRR
ncbi:GGDEF domain-containing protein [Kitasatospora herbaricolor]|uniref:GGDEF domain-containing protein n=1 Tax=Kitasatospora herbaricolor TaxID=68217 RepID=UPI0017484CAE|nr:GGDEF domain-containing protein [Kitasatospora herbaricolor]MDQ0311316.1 diguanylate cyclase (GGDEF)-like protein [Kitasatospora herbaricolor]GGV37126.1 GGDEF domain-containing protein [Kitasatospora herbaricolor]